MNKRFMRFIAAALAVFCLLGTTAFAAGYSDVDGHWAQEYIDDMTARGLYNGYNDNTFRPDELFTMEQAIAVCVRACAYPEELRIEVYDVYAELLDEVFGTDKAWFREDFAVAVEAGIISMDELAEAYKDGSLSSSITREQFTRYLVIAMQLLQPPQGWTLNFLDTADINTKHAADVYLLNSLGIIVGDTKGNFNPKSAVKRSDSATMFSRAVKYMEDNGLVPELERLVDYTVTAGSIQAVTEHANGAVTLTLKQGRNEPIDIMIPSAAKVYEHNVLTERDAMYESRYAKVLSGDDGKVFAVRMYVAPMTYSGNIAALNESSIIIDTGTTKRAFALDSRYTQVMLASTTLDGRVPSGNVGIIDHNAGYTTAECVVDETDGLAFLYLMGGQYTEQAVFSSVTDGVMTVLDYEGRTHKLKMQGTMVTVDEETAGSSLAKYKGHGVTLTLDSDTQSVIAADISGDITYIQGGLTRITQRSNANTTLSVVAPGTKKETVYTTVSAVKAYDDGERITLTSLPENRFVTLRMENGFVTDVYATAATRTIEGEVVDITYGSVVMIDIMGTDGTVETVELDVKALPVITRSGKLSSIDKILPRDNIAINIKYNLIVDIELAAPTADFVATVGRIAIDSDGTHIDLTTDDDITQSYLVSTVAQITQNGKSIALSALVPGSKVGVVVSGSMITSIDVEEIAATAGEVSGKVLYINTSDRTILLQTDNGNMSVNYPISPRIINVKGENVNLVTLEIGDTLQIMGAYGGDGTFTAELIIKK